MRLLSFASIAVIFLAACSPPAAPGTVDGPGTIARPAGATTTPAAVDAVPAQPGPAPQSRAIPARFHGHWAASAARCEAAGDESALEIRHDHVAFHESSGPVLRAMDDGDALEVLLHLTGEGETREAWYAFRLEDGGTALVDTRADFRRVRCGSVRSR